MEYVEYLIGIVAYLTNAPLYVKESIHAPIPAPTVLCYPGSLTVAQSVIPTDQQYSVVNSEICVIKTTSGVIGERVGGRHADCHRSVIIDDVLDGIHTAAYRRIMRDLCPLLAQVLSARRVITGLIRHAFFVYRTCTSEKVISRGHPAPVAAVGGTRDQLLLREIHLRLTVDLYVSFQSSQSTEGPAASAVPLILGRGHSVVVAPVEAGGKSCSLGSFDLVRLFPPFIVPIGNDRPQTSLSFFERQNRDRGLARSPAAAVLLRRLIRLVPGHGRAGNKDQPKAEEKNQTKDFENSHSPSSWN